MIASLVSGWLKYPTDMSDEKKKRKAPIPYRPSKKAEVIIQQETEKTGLSRNAYIDMRITNAKAMRKSRSTPIDKKMLGELLVQATLLNQTHSNPSQADPEISDNTIDNAIIDIRNGIFLLLGKKP